MTEKNFEGGENKRQFDRRSFFRKTIPVVAAMPFIIGCKKVESNQENELIDQVNQIISEYNITDRSSVKKVILKLKNISDNPVADLADLVNTEDSESRYNVYFALMLLGEKSESDRNEVLQILDAGLDDREPHINASIANFLIYYGEKKGLPVLIEKLDKKYNDVWMLSEPPLALPVYALKGLKRYTRQDFGNDINAWQTWWDENKDKLEWNDQRRCFIIVE